VLENSSENCEGKMVKNKQMENAKAAAAALCVFKRPPPTILRHVVALSLIKRTLSCRLCPFKGNSSATLPLKPATNSFLLVCHKLFLNAYLCGILPRAAATTFHNFYLHDAVVGDGYRGPAPGPGPGRGPS